MWVWAGAGWAAAGLGSCRAVAGIADQVGAGLGGAGQGLCGAEGWAPHRWPGTPNRSVPLFLVLTTRGLSDAASQSPHTVSGDPNVPVELPPSPRLLLEGSFQLRGRQGGGAGLSLPGSNSLERSLAGTCF